MNRLAVLTCCFLIVLFPGYMTAQYGENVEISEADFAHIMGAYSANIAELETYFDDQQAFFQRINPPDPDFLLHQPGFPTLVPVDFGGMPQQLVQGLTSYYEYSVPVYPLWITENFITRETIFENAKGTELYRLSPPNGYNPNAYALQLMPNLFSGVYSSYEIERHLKIFDPARVRIFAKLIDENDVELYLYVEAVLRLQQLAMNESSEQMVQMSESEEFKFTAMTDSGGIAMTINLAPEFTNDVDIYTCSDLLAESWTFAERDIAYPGTNYIDWIDTNDWVTSGTLHRFYAAGDAETDTDGDGYANTREVMVYQTDPYSATSKPVVVSGEIQCSGSETGTTYVLFVNNSNDWSMAKSLPVAGGGGYTNNEISNS